MAKLSRQQTSSMGERLGLPPTEFLYTMDQVCYLLNIPIAKLRTIVLFAGLIGYTSDDFSGFVPMRAVRILPSTVHERPEWRIPESELLNYLESMGIEVHVRELR